MNRTVRLSRWLPFTVAAIVLTGVLSFAAGAAAPADRLAGADRIATTIEISQHAFPNGSLEVYIANREVNPDALVGGTLTKGPILLVPQCGALPDAVADEIARLAPFRVLALGGSAVVCDDTLAQAAAAAPGGEDPGPFESVQRSAQGEGASETFELRGGSYRLFYDYDGDCRYHPFLEAVGAGQSESFPSGGGPVDGETLIHNVEPGRYAIDMITGAAPDCTGRSRSRPHDGGTHTTQAGLLMTIHRTRLLTTVRS